MNFQRMVAFTCGHELTSRKLQMCTLSSLLRCICVHGAFFVLQKKKKKTDEPKKKQKNSSFVEVNVL